MTTISNIPVRIDFRHRSASIQTIPLEFKLSDGSPENITGRDYEFNVRKSRTSNDVIVSYSTGNGAIVITDGPGGLALLTINDVATPLMCGEFLYDCDEAVPSSILNPLFAGTFEVASDL